MAELKVRGHSDDIVCIEGGGFMEEFYPGASNRIYVAFSDGTVLRAHYEDGAWDIKRLCEGSSIYSHAPNEGSDSQRYSDVVTLDGQFTWCVAGDGFQRSKPRSTPPATP
jgi:hypothetical protein